MDKQSNNFHSRKTDPPLRQSPSEGRSRALGYALGAVWMGISVWIIYVVFESVILPLASNIILGGHEKGYYDYPSMPLILYGFVAFLRPVLMVIVNILPILYFWKRWRDLALGMLLIDLTFLIMYVLWVHILGG